LLLLVLLLLLPWSAVHGHQDWHAAVMVL